MAEWTLLTKLPIKAGENPPNIFFLVITLALRLDLRVERFPPVFTFGDTKFVAVIGGRIQPVVGALEMAGAFEDGWRASGLKYSDGDKYPAPVLRLFL